MWVLNGENYTITWTFWTWTQALKVKIWTWKDISAASMTTFVKWVIMKITDEPAILVLQVPQLETGVSYRGGGCIKKFRISYRVILMTWTTASQCTKFCKIYNTYMWIYIYNPLIIFCLASRNIMICKQFLLILWSVYKFQYLQIQTLLKLYRWKLLCLLFKYF